MTKPRQVWRRTRPAFVLLVLGVGLGLIAPGRCRAQFAPSGGFSDPFSDLGFGGMQSPQTSTEGEWAQVLTVTPLWLVLQNQKGQQFPVSTTEIGTFLIRWPTTLDRLAAGTMIETTGIDMGTNQISTDHVDVFEGTAEALGVSPTVETIVGFNRVLTAFDIAQQNTYGYDMFRMLSPAELEMPRRLHVVGPLAGLNPLQIGLGGNIGVAVFPSANGVTVTSVSPGSASFVREGDLVFASPVEAAPKTLRLAQLVVYKNAPNAPQAGAGVAPAAGNAIGAGAAPAGIAR